MADPGGGSGLQEFVNFTTEIGDSLLRLQARVVALEVRLVAVEAKLQGVLVGTMAATMLPQLIALHSTVDENGPLTEDGVVEWAFKMAGKLAVRMETAIKKGG